MVDYGSITLHQAVDCEIAAPTSICYLLILESLDSNFDSVHCGISIVEYGHSDTCGTFISPSRDLLADPLLASTKVNPFVLHTVVAGSGVHKNGTKLCVCSTGAMISSHCARTEVRMNLD